MNYSCPKCINKPADKNNPNSPLVSTIRIKKKDGYMECTECGRRWAIVTKEINDEG